jgi:hypothetical protein
MSRSTAVAARTTTRRDASDALETDADTGVAKQGDPFDEEVDDADDDPADEHLEGDDEALAGDLTGDDVAADEDLADDGDKDSAPVATFIVAPDAAFDDDDALAAAVVGDEDDDEDDEIEGLRDGEFVCRSCHLAMRDTQLANAKNMICRDCV